MNAVIGARPFSAFPCTISLIDQLKPRSIGTSEDKYCASSISIPLGQSALLYPRQAVNIAAFAVSVPKVAT